MSAPEETEEAGLSAFLILNTFQAVPAQCPTVASASSVASPAFSPYLFENQIESNQIFFYFMLWHKKENPILIECNLYSNSDSSWFNETILNFYRFPLLVVVHSFDDSESKELVGGSSLLLKNTIGSILRTLMVWHVKFKLWLHWNLNVWPKRMT